MIQIPRLFLVLYGLVLVYEQTRSGLIISLVLSLSGLFAFTIHIYFLSQGQPEFRLPISIFILLAILVVSLFQGTITLHRKLIRRVLQANGIFSGLRRRNSK